ncbi:MAG TPA: cell division protein FtsQ/DivIB [Solirubrobacteraceae bacterium]|jgi:cell division septal protein FtsQ
MERPLTARLPFGRLTLPAARGRPAPGLASARAALALLGRRRRSARIALLAALVSLALLGGGYLALRHSSFVAVQRVRISGVEGAEAPAIRTALESAARHMSTLDVNAAALQAAVAQFDVVRALRASARFPHGLDIAVVEQTPVAALVAGGVHTAVAADGVVLGPGLLSQSLPTLAGWLAPAPGAHLHDRSLLAALQVLGAAPRRLAAHVARAYSGAQGLTVAMHNGLVVYFGDDVRPHAKWLALARVLADPSSAGAIYIDVRVPDRPAAGFPAGAGPPSAASASERIGTSESPIGALAESLSGPAAAAKGTEPSTETAPQSTSSAPAPAPTSGAPGTAGAPTEASESATPPSAEGATEAGTTGG